MVDEISIVEDLKLRRTIDDEDRLAALRRYQILDTPPEPDYDFAVEVLRTDCKTPCAAITLVDRDRQWFKAHKGFDFPEAPRSVGFCSVAMHHNQPLIVEDARLDRRFARNAAVTGDPFVRFYAGAPLVSNEGYPLGAVCVFDMEPRTLFPAQIQLLSRVRHLVQANLELHRLDRLVAAAGSGDSAVLEKASRWRTYVRSRVEKARSALFAHKAAYSFAGPIPVPRVPRAGFRHGADAPALHLQRSGESRERAAV